MASNFLDQWKQSGRKINHSGFDVSGKRAFSTPAGLMTCPFFMETNPNEHFELDVQGLLRTETLNTAAFVSGKQLTSLFFVPYSQIWQNYNSFVTQKDDRHSATQKSMSYLPCISLRELYWLYFSFYVTYRWVKIRIDGEPTPDNYPSSTADSVTFARSYDQLHIAYAPKFSFAFDMHGIPYVHNLGRAIQYYRLGTPYVISAMVDKLFNDNYTPDDDPVADKVAKFGALEAAASHTIVATFQDSDWFADKYVNIMRPAAYQHIFYDYYRNKFFDEEPYYQNTSGDSIRYVDIYNYDDLECSSIANSAITVSHVRIPHAPENFAQARIMNLFDLHYRQYKHDIFTSAMNSTQFGAVSSVSFEGTGDVNFGSGASGRFIRVNSDGSLAFTQFGVTPVVKSLQTSSLDYVEPVGDYTDGTTAVFGNNLDAQSTSFVSGGNIGEAAYASLHGSFSSPSFSIPSLFDVLQLRRAELLQQWKMNALRAGNMVDDNFRQHYGVEPYYESDNNVRLVGSWECDLNVNPVTATSSTGQDVNGNVGDLAAIGVGSVKGHKVRLKCNDFGVIVAISYFLPDVYYSANGIDGANTLLEPFDFYSEEFENCGFEPLPIYTQSIGNFANNSDNLGFVPPYTLYKTNTDVVFGEFGELNAIGATGVDDFTYQGSLRAWTMQRSDVPTTYVNGVLVRDKSAFYIDPKVTNPIFALYYNGNQNTDPLHCFYNFDVKALRPMSVLGLPIFS